MLKYKKSADRKFSIYRKKLNISWLRRFYFPENLVDNFKRKEKSYERPGKNENAMQLCESMSYGL